MIRSVYLTQPLYLSMLAIVVLYVVGYKVHVPYAVHGPELLLIGILLVLYVSLLWISNKGLPGVRDTPDRMSNGDNNEIVISVKNRYTFPVRLTIIDEIPVQFQKRDFRITCQLQPGEEKRFSYLLRPLQRGEYLFGALNIYVRGMIGFAERRYR